MREHASSHSVVHGKLVHGKLLYNRLFLQKDLLQLSPCFKPKPVEGHFRTTLLFLTVILTWGRVRAVTLNIDHKFRHTPTSQVSLPSKVIQWRAATTKQGRGLQSISKCGQGLIQRISV